MLSKKKIKPDRWAREIIQSTNCLPYKHRYLSSLPRTHRKDRSNCVLV